MEDIIDLDALNDTLLNDKLEKFLSQIQKRCNKIICIKNHLIIKIYENFKSLPEDLKFYQIKDNKYIFHDSKNYYYFFDNNVAMKIKNAPVEEENDDVIIIIDKGTRYVFKEVFSNVERVIFN